MNPSKPAQKDQPMTPQEMQHATELIMRELGANINAAIRDFFPGSGFALVVFPINNPKIANYISNTSKPLMAEALKETAKRINSNEDSPADLGAMH